MLSVLVEVVELYLHSPYDLRVWTGKDTRICEDNDDDDSDSNDERTSKELMTMMMIMMVMMSELWAD